MRPIVFLAFPERFPIGDPIGNRICFREERSNRQDHFRDVSYLKRALLHSRAAALAYSIAARANESLSAHSTSRGKTKSTSSKDILQKFPYLEVDSSCRGYQNLPLQNNITSQWNVLSFSSLGFSSVYTKLCIQQISR